MKSFDVCPLKGREGRRVAPLVIVIQHDLLDNLATRVVAPLYFTSDVPPAHRLRPIVTVLGKPMTLAIDRIATVSVRDLGQAVAALPDIRDQVVAAVDLLFTGI